MILAAQWYHTILAFMFAIIALLVIVVILLQRGRGVGLAGAFGGSGGATAFGAKTGDVLTWVTIIGAILLLTYTVILNYVFVDSGPGLATVAGPTGQTTVPPAAPAPTPAQPQRMPGGPPGMPTPPQGMPAPAATPVNPAQSPGPGAPAATPAANEGAAPASGTPANEGAKPAGEVPPPPPPALENKPAEPPAGGGAGPLERHDGVLYAVATIFGEPVA
jgi:preprotein translocase subunit SecG